MAIKKTSSQIETNDDLFDISSKNPQRMIRKYFRFKSLPDFEILDLKQEASKSKKQTDSLTSLEYPNSNSRLNPSSDYPFKKFRVASKSTSCLNTPNSTCIFFDKNLGQISDYMNVNKVCDIPVSPSQLESKKRFDEERLRRLSHREIQIMKEKLQDVIRKKRAQINQQAHKNIESLNKRGVFTPEINDFREKTKALPKIRKE